jgi:CysZ protein
MPGRTPGSIGADPARPAPGPNPTERIRAAVGGFRLPLEGARLLLHERRLWAPALVPFLLSLVAFATAIGLVLSQADVLYGWATGWLPALGVDRWYQWLWIGPAWLLLKALGAALFLALAGAGVVAAYLVAGLLASPFHDALSRRVEEVLAGSAVDASEAGLVGALRDAVRAAREELRRLGFFALVAVPLVLLGLLAPPLAPLWGACLTAFTIFFLPLEYASYALDRRRVSFAERRRWLLAHGSATLGFGLAAFLLCTIPLVNFLAMPVLVTAGTLLALRHPALGAASPSPS